VLTCASEANVKDAMIWEVREVCVNGCKESLSSQSEALARVASFASMLRWQCSCLHRPWLAERPFDSIEHEYHARSNANTKRIGANLQ
jgi:hypothetical protein